MIQITPQMRFLLAVKPVDFRRGIDGLSPVPNRSRMAGTRAALNNYWSRQPKSQPGMATRSTNQ